MGDNLIINDKSDALSGIKISPFRTHIRKTQPHKHNSYLEIIYLSQGSGTHNTDTATHTIRTPMVLTVRQDQVHHWDITSEPEGYVLILKKDFLDFSLDKELKLFVARLASRPVFYLEPANDVGIVLELLCREYAGSLELAASSIEGLLKAFLAKVLSQPDTEGGVAEEIKTDMYRAFTELLSLEGSQKKTVAYYADKLSTTPQNLNASCQRIAGKPASDILAEFVISEAKRLLLYTDKKSSEISYLLDFSDPSHFVKFFKRHAGKTPKDYRATQL